MPISEYIRKLRLSIGTDVLLVPGAAAIIINEAGEVLLQRRSDNGLWGLPGGVLDPGEEPADAIVREVWEETGLDVIPERIVGIYSGPDFQVVYPNGDRVSIVSVAFACRPVAGEPHVHDDESLEIRYFSPDALPALEPRHLIRVQHALQNDPKSYFRVTYSTGEKP
jgi:8-oxo-dGTP diphosphatase